MTWHRSDWRRDHAEGCSAAFVGKECTCPPPYLMVPTDDEARGRANEALCRFLFPGIAVPRSEMVDAVIVALAGAGDWRADLPQRRVV